MPRLSRISDYYESSEAGSSPSSPGYEYMRLSPAPTERSEADLISDRGSPIYIPEADYDGLVDVPESVFDGNSLSDGLTTDCDSSQGDPVILPSPDHDHVTGLLSAAPLPDSNDVQSTNPNNPSRGFA